MSELTLSQPIPLPEPVTPITIRRATMDDLAFMDSLQKKHSKELGFFSRMQMESYIDGGHVLIAEVREGEAPAEPGLADHARGSAGASPSRKIGYVLSKDRYLKRDELGAVFQLCVDPGYRRGFVGAALLKAVFEQSAYGCRLYCCWCAQDLAANRFWESMGFVPIAYRAGGRGKVGGRQSAVGGETPPHSPPTAHRRRQTRVHIYWQKRIRENDTTTPYWFPAKTEGGAIREDRIILPIPPGVHWSEPMPMILPVEGDEALALDAGAPPRLGNVEASAGRDGVGTSGRHQGERTAAEAAVKAAGSGSAAKPRSKPAPKRVLKTVLGACLRFAAAQAADDGAERDGAGRDGAGGSARRCETAAPGTAEAMEPVGTREPAEVGERTKPQRRSAKTAGQASTVRESAGRESTARESGKQEPAGREPGKRSPSGRNDPAVVARARELRDRYLEHINAQGSLQPQGKYDPARLPAPPMPARPMLAA